MILVCKAPVPPLPPLSKVRGDSAPVMHPVPASVGVTLCQPKIQQLPFIIH